MRKPPQCANIRGRGQTKKESDVNNSKACTKCGQIKTFSEFNIRRASPDGHAYLCRPCDKLAKSKYWQENKEKLKPKNNANYHAKKESRKPLRTAYELAHREESNARVRKWKANNRDAVRVYSVQRRKKKFVNGVFEIRPKELRRLYESPCFFCGSLENIHADHVVPISKGGRHSIGNLIPACQKCNCSRGSQFISAWLKKRLAPPTYKGSQSAFLSGTS